MNAIVTGESGTLEAEGRDPATAATATAAAIGRHSAADCWLDMRAAFLLG